MLSRAIIIHNNNNNLNSNLIPQSQIFNNSNSLSDRVPALRDSSSTLPSLTNKSREASQSPRTRAVAPGKQLAV